MKTPQFWYRNKSIISLTLLPLSFIWLLFYFIKTAFKKKFVFTVPIMCVGNSIAGGSGKTPLTIEICKYYRKKNINLHVVYKAYKIKMKKNVISVNREENMNNVEDEAILISNYAPTWLCKKRKDGISSAIKSGAELILLDDGLQDSSISKNINILVSNQTQGNGNLKIIPAGPLREPLYISKKKSSCIFFYGDKKYFNHHFYGYKKNVFFGKIKIDHRKISSLKKKRIIAFAGIAHPNNFFTLLHNNNLNIIEKIYFPDHYKYNRDELEKILLKSNELSALPITTYKDYVKIPRDLKKYFAMVDIYIKFDKDNFFKFINEKIGKRA